MTIANFVPRGSKVADIGTDHAYLPIYLVQEGVCPSAVGGDVHRGPFEAALRAVREAGLGDAIAVKMGDGLAVVEPGEVEAVVIAGMGGGTIRGILEASPQVADQLVRLILQPMVDAAPLREWLLHNGWQIIDEELAEEENRLYEVIVAERAKNSLNQLNGDLATGLSIQLDPVLLEVGPKLVEKRHPLLAKHLDKLILDRKWIIRQLQNSASPLAQEKAEKTAEWVAKLQNLKDSIYQGENR
jgi:tRNA (adenine22-N1)-methyltransferase